MFVVTLRNVLIYYYYDLPVAICTTRIAGDLIPRYIAVTIGYLT